MELHSSANILIVDDQVGNLLAFEAILKDVADRIVTVSSGEAALSEILRSDFALILMDVMMPAMDGYETARYIRAREKTRCTPIIFITASSPDDARTLKGYALGAVDFLYKPISQEILRSKVSFFVDSYRKAQQIKEMERQTSSLQLLEARHRWEAERLRQEVEIERSTAESLTMFRLLVENVKDYAIFIMDAHGVIISWNVAAERILGYRTEEIVGKHFSKVFTEEDCLQGIPAKELERAEKHGRAEDLRWHLAKDGSLFWAEGVVTPLREENGYLRGFAKLLRDNTQRKHFEDNLKKMADQSARSNEELEHFASIASHDLQEPLRMVTSYMTLLRRKLADKLDQEAEEYFDFAIDGAQRMKALIESLLNYSRVGTRERKQEIVDCSILLGEVQNNLKVAIEESGAQVDVAPLPSIKADSRQLSQVFQNLIGNALKYHKPKEAPRIRISSSKRGNEWLFSVADNGIGIDMRFAERIFAVFQRLLHNDEYPGTGLGLSVCKKIIAGHGGKIWVESVLDRGSVFYFTLPAAAEL